MIETFANFDHSLFLTLNGMHTDFMDVIMAFVSDKFVWIPLYIAAAIYLFKRFGNQSLYMMLFTVLLIVLSDQGSVLIKNTVQRSRPCHHEAISFLVHTVNNKCGGPYGFVSSHAANTMALFTFIMLLTRHQAKWLTWSFAGWVALVGYSRVYLGVHFPGDIAGGWIVGIIAAIITYIIYRLIFESPQARDI